MARGPSCRRGCARSTRAFSPEFKAEAARRGNETPAGRVVQGGPGELAALLAEHYPCVMALPSLIDDALRRFSSALRERFAGRLREVVLFGSFARGEAHEESDVDVLVVVDDLTEKERREVLDLAYDVALAAPEWVGLSPLPYSTAQAAELRGRERRLFRDIDREGVPL